MTYLNPKTGQTIGYQETSGTVAEPYTAPMLWQASTLSYVPMLADASGNLLTSGGGGGGGNSAAGPTGSAVPAYAGYTGFNSGGNLVGVSAANPLPVAASGTITLTGGTESEGATGSAVPAYATNLGFNAAGNLVGVSSSSPLPVGVAVNTYSSQAGSSTSSGTIHATTAGKTAQLYYYMINADPSNGAAITVNLYFTSGNQVTNVSLVPGSILARNIGAGKYYLSGAISDNLLITLTGTGKVNWAIEYQEV